MWEERCLAARSFFTVISSAKVTVFFRRCKTLIKYWVGPLSYTALVRLTPAKGPLRSVALSLISSLNVASKCSVLRRSYCRCQYVLSFTGGPIILDVLVLKYLSALIA